MLKEITFDELKKMWESGRVLYIYPDGSDAYVDINDHWSDLMRHLDNGGKFAIEEDDSN